MARDIKSTRPKDIFNKISANFFSLMGFFNKMRKSKATYIILGLGGFAILAFLLSKWIVVAWVDNIPITRLEYYKALEAQSGSGVLEEIIVEKLIQNEAVKKNSQVTKEEIEAEIAKIEKEQGGKENLQQSLEIYGYTQEKFRKLVKLQLIKQKLFGSTSQVSDTEVSKFLEDNKNQYENPTDKDREQIKEQLKMQKLNATFSAWVKSSLGSPRVNRN